MEQCLDCSCLCNLKTRMLPQRLRFPPWVHIKWLNLNTVCSYLNEDIVVHTFRQTHLTGNVVLHSSHIPTYKEEENLFLTPYSLPVMVIMGHCLSPCNFQKVTEIFSPPLALTILLMLAGYWRLPWCPQAIKGRIRVRGKICCDSQKNNVASLHYSYFYYYRNHNWKYTPWCTV